MKTQSFILYLLSFMVLYSCTEDEISIPPDDLSKQINQRSDKAEFETITYANKFIKLGERKKIPSSVQNMKLALADLAENPTSIYFNLQKEHHANSVSRNDLTLGDGRGGTSSPISIMQNYQVNETHKYIKLETTDSTKYERLLTDSLLNVSNIPFEYDVIENGDVYSDTPFAPLYAVVPVNMTLPRDVAITTVERMHFTKEDDITTETPTADEERLLDFYEEINLTTLFKNDWLIGEELNELVFRTRRNLDRITYTEAIALGYTRDDLYIDFQAYWSGINCPHCRLFRRRRRWTPRGQIEVEDNVINQNLGLEGAKVTVRKWGFLVIRKTKTNQSGQFQTRRTRTQRVKYAAVFKQRETFSVRAGTVFFQAKHRGERRYRRNQEWNQLLAFGSRPHFYASIHNAAYDYFNKHVQNYGLKEPVAGPSYNIRLSAKFNGKSSSHSDIYSSYWSEIRIARLRGRIPRPSDGLYASTVHELTHAGHFQGDSEMFAPESLFSGNIKERLLMTESWAEGVETILTNDRYFALEPNYVASRRVQISGWRRWNSDRQAQTVAQMNAYTPLVIDLIDNLNQNDYFDLNSDGREDLSGNQPIDRVSGYTLAQIQQSLFDSNNLNDWEVRLRAQHNNETELFVNDVFTYARQVAARL